MPSPAYGTNRTILSVTRLENQEDYYDLQVEGTQNYVCAGGFIHHNSTKTTASILKIAYEAQRIAPCRDGVRRSRAVWIRQTREQLRDTSIPDFLRWFPDGPAGVYMKTEQKFLLRFDDVECEVLFRGLDDSNDVRRLLSLQATFGVADEFRELNPAVFEALQGRLGRYPSKADNGVGACDEHGNQIDKFWGASNPPDFDTWWEQYLSNPPSNAAVFFQPSGMSPEADWLQYLKDGYYENLADGKHEDWVDVYIHAKFGKSLSGRPVFPSFDSAFHVASGPLKAIRSAEKPLVVGMDFGLSPAAVIGQNDLQGRLLVLACATSEGMGITRFIQDKLKPLLADRFPGHPLIVVGDPAGSQRAQTDERSCFDILKAEGFQVVPARTNSVQGRISAVEKFLGRQVEGKAGMLFDPEAREIIQAMRGGYRYKLKKSGEMQDTPEKNHHSHVADALQYLCVHADGGTLYGTPWGAQRREIKRVSAVGWT